MQPQQQEPSSAERLKATANWVFFVVRSLAVIAEVSFLRKGFGERYLGMQTFFALPVLLVYMAFWPGHDPRPLLWYLVLYLVMCGVARIDIARRRRAGLCVHSRHNGFPRIARLCPGMSEVAIKRSAEPLLVAGMGMLVAMVNLPLGFFLLLTAVALFLTTGMNEAYERVRALDMHDMVIEQQQIAERFRTLRGQHI